MEKLFYLLVFLVISVNLEGIPSRKGCPVSGPGIISTGITECQTESNEYPASSPFKRKTRRHVMNDPVKCKNPKNREGLCISLDKCEPLYALVSGKLTEDSVQFLRNSHCPGATRGLPNYCCDSGSTKSIYFPPEHVPQYMPSNGVGRNIPNTKCGPPTAPNKIYSGIEAEIDDFPWMALIEYRLGGERKLKCAGSIINQRYIVTAAHCVNPKQIRKHGQPTLVRLGDHDISSELDCNEESYCNNRIVEIGIEKIIPHENYDANIPNSPNDIALIRLNQNIPIDNPFIQPICLPNAVGYKLESAKDLTVAGWGNTERGTTSNIKLKLNVPVSSHEYCSDKYATYGGTIINSQLCAGGKKSQDTCAGDSGGPLMGFMNSFWVLVGIVSYGYQCGQEGWPGVYTRVHDYESWIMKNLEP